jgi:hypothetical protein
MSIFTDSDGSSEHTVLQMASHQEKQSAEGENDEQEYEDYEPEETTQDGDGPVATGFRCSVRRQHFFDLVVRAGPFPGKVR